MPVCLDIDRTNSQDALRLRIGLVNNMPDGALQATERQYVKLLDLASGGLAVHLSLYALPDVPRGDWGRNRLGRYYSSLDTLWDSQIDGLIVTGTEPVTSNLAEEPYWGSLTKIFEWTERNPVSTICSCLATHAAVLYFDGIARRRLNEKRFGVFRCKAAANHLLLTGLPPVVHVPHSRWNDLSEDDLRSHGYRILTHAEEGGVNSFLRPGKNLSLFLQGHPEYESNTLLLEYRRDLGRYLRGERDAYPRMPQNYFDREAAKILDGFRDRAVQNRREELMTHFPASALEDGIRNRWRSSGVRLYTNWLSFLAAKKQGVKKTPRLISRAALKPRSSRARL